jgi:hypothetical protein
MINVAAMVVNICTMDVERKVWREEKELGQPYCNCRCTVRVLDHHTVFCEEKREQRASKGRERETGKVLSVHIGGKETEFMYIYS